IEVSYESGMPEIYQLPVVFGEGQAAEKTIENCPQSVICRFKIDKEEGILYDAVYGRELQQFIFEKMAAKQTITLKNSEISLSGDKQLKKYLKDHDDVKSRVLAAEQSNTSIVYDSNYFLKIYRKLDRAINPDLEINRFLSEKAKFKHIPDFVGAIEWKYGKETIVLGMMQNMVPNQGDAWVYMLDRLRNYNDRI